MAGFFGLFDYSKPGKGVRKDEPQKPRFVFFWELYFRKFWKICQLNLLFILFCLPVVTIGPATAGLVYVLRNLVNEQPVFLFSDFWDSFKNNWKQSFIYSVLMAVCAFIVSVSVQFYFANSGVYSWMIIPAALTLFVGLTLVLMSFYVMLMIVTLDLPLPAILKNAAILSVLCIKANLLTLLFSGLILFASLCFPVIGMLLLLVLTPATIGFIVCYNSYPGIKRYAIDPFYADQAAGDEEDGDALFRDEEPPESL